MVNGRSHTGASALPSVLSRKFLKTNPEVIPGSWRYLARPEIQRTSEKSLNSRFRGNDVKNPVRLLKDFWDTILARIIHGTT